MPQELLFELDDVRVTPYVAQFGSTSYQIASIGSVRAVQRKRLSRIAVAMFLAGAALLVAAMLRSGNEHQADSNFPLAVAGAGIVLVSLLVQLILPGKLYKLILRSHGGEIELSHHAEASSFLMSSKRLRRHLSPTPNAPAAINEH